jgi:4-amino-4-deoxy-L-arabinose transferase-like glycosyltransferase
MARSWANSYYITMPFSRKDLLALAVYTILALAFTYPLITVIGTSTVGDGVDGWQDTWEMWWLNRALATGTPPYHFATLYAPDGATNYLHSLNPIEIVLTLPVQWLFGPIASYNVAAVSALVFGALGAYLLARDVAGSRMAGFAAGLVFGFAPRQFAQLLGHLDVASIQFVALGVWCHHRGLRAKGRRALTWLLWCAACIAACALTHPYALIAIVLIVALAGLYRSLEWRKQRAWIVQTARTLLSLVVGLVVVAPLLYAMAWQLAGPDAPRRREIPAEIWEERTLFSADLAAYVIPSPFHPLWGAAARSNLEMVTGGHAEKVVFPGYAAVGLGLIGVVARATRQRARLWWIAGLVGAVLSLGPSLRVGGTTTGTTLPAIWFYFLVPGSEMMRVPARFSMILMLGLAVCSGLGARVLWERIRVSSWRRAAMAAVPLLIMFEYLPVPYPTSASSVEPWHEAVGARPGTGSAVLEVPFNPGDAKPLMRQMVHGLPLAGGYLSRQPAEPISGGVPPFAELGLNRPPGLPPFDRASHTMCQPKPDASSYLDIMRLARVRYVTVHRGALAESDPRQSLLGSLLSSPPIYDSTTMLVYDTGGGDAPPGLLGITEDWEDWFEVENGRSRWALTRTARLHIWSGAERDITLHLNLRSYGQERDVTFRLGTNNLLRTRAEEDERPLSITWRVNRGFTTVGITSSGPSITPNSVGMGRDMRPLTIGISDCRLEVADSK